MTNEQDGNGRERGELPRGWAWAKFADVVSLTAGSGAPQGKEYFEGGSFPFVRVQDMGNLSGKVYIHDTRDHLNRTGIPKMRLFPKGSVLFTKSGMSILLNQRAILAKDMYVVGHIGVAQPVGGIRSEFVYYWLKTVDFKELTHATTLPSLQLSKVQDLDVPLPPLAEQRRIVAKIEEVFSDLDAGVAALQITKAQLKRYRQAVLKAAVEGKLTAEWREANKGKIEPASGLLDRIREERAKNANGKGKIVSPVGAAELGKLPDGWCWATIDELTDTIGGVTKGRDFKGKKTVHLPYLRVANVQRGYLDLSEVKKIETLESETAKYLLKENDLVLTEGGDWDKLGRSAIWKNQVASCIHQNHIFRARLYLRDMPIKWLMYYTNSEQGKAYFVEAAKQTTNLASINLTQLRACPVPLPPLAEQHYIVAEVERRLSVADEIEKVVERSLKQAARLRQSILIRAFAGKLVPQDPSDEPTERLLERIKAQTNAKKESLPEQMALPIPSAKKVRRRAT